MTHNSQEKTLVDGTKQKFITFLKIALPILALLLLLLAMVFVFRGKIANMFELEMEDKLLEITRQTKQSFDQKIENRFKILSIISEDIRRGNDFAAVLKQVEKSEGEESLYERTGAIYLNGNVIYGNPLATDNLELFAETLRGVGQVVYLDKSVFSDTPCVLVSVPIYSDRNISGLVYEVIKDEQLESLFYTTMFNGKGFTFCSRKAFSSPVISADVPAESAEIALRLMSDESNKVALGLLNKKMYYFGDAVETFSFGGNEYYICSVSLEKPEGWYGMSIVPAKVVSEKLNFVLLLATIFFIFLSLLFFTVFLLLSENDRKSREQMHTLAYYDKNTKLFNFEGLKLYQEATINEQRFLVAIDIDQFSMVNRIMGETYSDNLLLKIADILTNELGKVALVCRVKDDTFAFCIRNTPDSIKNIKATLEKCCACSKNYPIRISCGVAEIAPNEKVSMSIFDRANAAKKTVKNNTADYKLAIYDETLRKKEIDSKKLEHDLSSALANEELLVYLQPKIDIATNRIAGAEALVRWQHPVRGMIYPGEFIPAFEVAGCINDLDLYMIAKTCELIRKWIDQGRTIHPISVNLSRSHISSKSIVSDLVKIVNKYNIPIENIELELTESAFFQDSNKLIDVMRSLKSEGFHLSIDDFGTGYSSLATLLEIPTDTIKLDKKFIDLWEIDHNSTLIKGIIDIAKSLNMCTLIEGIETKEQVDLLKSLNCQIGQGFYFSKPIPVEVYENMVFSESGGNSSE